MRFASLFLMSNPFMYETHMQIMSDALVTKNGKLGTVRDIDQPQYPSLYYANEDLKVPFRDTSMPHLDSTFALGAFTRCFENIFFRQYKGYDKTFRAEVTGKPSKHAFDLAKTVIKQQIIENEPQLFMVGDSLNSDIKGGNDNGFKTLLVKTGNYKDGDNIPAEAKPNYIVEGVKEAVELILSFK